MLGVAAQASVPAWQGHGWWTRSTVAALSLPLRQGKHLGAIHAHLPVVQIPPPSPLPP